jgi:hypothetical protein
VVVQPPPDADPRRLTDLRRAQPADATTQTLFQLLNSKIELCGQLVIYEYEAATEGHEACAEAFRELADVERASYQTLLKCLTNLLAEAPAGSRPVPGTAPRRTRFRGSQA